MNTNAYQYNLSGEYIGETVAYGGLLPANTTAVAPTLQAGHWPVWQNGAWVNMEDNRQTPYWLEGDTHETQARYIKELGPLPEGALLAQPEKPEPTMNELASRLRTERDTRIISCDWVITRHRDELDEGGSATLTADEYATWLTYRKALRDLPAQDGFPWDGGEEETPWPTQPQN